MSEQMKKNARGNEPKGDARYHNTWLLLRKYRDVMWSLETSVSQAKLAFSEDYGMTLDDFLDSTYSAGIDLSDTRLETQARRIKQNSDMIRLVDRAVEIMRIKHYKGEEYYWILYYSYLSPQDLANVDEILDSLRHHIRDISKRTYYRKRREAIDILSSLLWGYADRETLGILGNFLQRE